MTNTQRMGKSHHARQPSGMVTPRAVGAGDRDRSTKETTSDLAYGELYAVGSGFDPIPFVDVSVDPILTGNSVGVFLVRRTSTFVDIRRFWIGICVDRIPIL